MLLTAAGATGHPVTIAGCSGRGTRTADAAGHEQIIGDQAVCVSEKAAQQLPLRRKHTGRIMEDYAFLCIYASRRNALNSAMSDVSHGMSRGRRSPGQVPDAMQAARMSFGWRSRLLRALSVHPGAAGIQQDRPAVPGGRLPGPVARPAAGGGGTRMTVVPLPHTRGARWPCPASGSPMSALAASKIRLRRRGPVRTGPGRPNNTG